MLGIVWDVNKFTRDQIVCIESYYKDEIAYLRHLVQTRDEQVLQLQNTILKHAGIIRVDMPETTSTPPNQFNPGKTWKGLKSKLEEKFRPPELAERERHWKEAAASAAVVLEVENASEVG